MLSITVSSLNVQSSRSRRERLSHQLFVLTAALILWALVVGLTGGFVLWLGDVRLSSRGARNPFIFSAVCLAAAWAIAPWGRRWRSLAESCRRLLTPMEVALASVSHGAWVRLSDLLVVAIVVAVIAIGVTKGSMVVGGSDSYGYVSQAHVWATGMLRVSPPLDGERLEGVPYSALVPLGYRLGADGRSLAPTYAPGFPMLMAVFERAGGPGAVFYAMPLLAGIAAAATYLLGTILGGRSVGLLAALMLASSPTFLFQLTHAPMSDIATAAWWTLVLALLPRESRSSALLMGIAAGAAIVTRPNLVPLAVVPGGLLVWNLIARHPRRGPAAARVILYAIGPLVASLTIASLNTYWYGVPTESGYGALAGELFRWEYLWPNVANYSRSLLESQGPGIILALVGAAMLWRHIAEPPDGPMPRRSLVVAYLSFGLVTYLAYAIYLPLSAWWALRFFLPVFPLLFVSLSIGVMRLSTFVPAYRRAVAVIAAVLILSQTTRFIRDMGVLDSSLERRFAAIGTYVAETLPSRAIVFSMLHSGSVTYYSGRPIIRYDLLPPAQFRAIASDVSRRGYTPFILLDVSERADFVRTYGDPDRLGTLDARAASLVPTVDLYRVH
jgi:hypothetical protein